MSSPVQPRTTIRFIPRNTPEYARDYQLGWAAGERISDGALDRADARGVSHAWYDGYADSAAGRRKWHLRTCPDHDTCQEN
jgi:hypothetical protein